MINYKSQNYISCESDMGEFNKKEEYQVLSPSNGNGINWRGQNNMYLMFTAIVVDPDFRYYFNKIK